MVEKLGTGVYCKESHFSDEVCIKELNILEGDAAIERWKKFCSLLFIAHYLLLLNSMS